MTATPWPAVVLIALLGLVIGSFLNVVIYRVPREESIAYPASHCPHCRVPIKPRYNVPVLGWLMLGGRCAACGEAISIRYPLVEAGTAVLFAGIALRFGLSLQLPAYLYLAAVGVTLAMIDFDVRRLPDSIVLPSYVVSVLLLMPAGAVDTSWWPAERALIGMAALWAIYFALALAYPQGSGFGDVKLAGLLGLYLGWLSWGAILIGALGGLILGVLGGAAVVATRPRHSLLSVAYGPCMIAGGGLAVFATIPLSTWYSALLASA